jgi:hypothetical protein
MKTRMIWYYWCNNFWGTCPKWAAELKALGYMAGRKKVMWVGELPPCPICVLGNH